MPIRRSSFSVVGLFVLAITGCGSATEDETETIAETSEGVKKGLCLADPPFAGDARKIFHINDHVIAFYDGRNTDRISPDPNWVDDAANKLGVATYAIHQGNKAVVIDTFPTIAQAQWQRSNLEAMGITDITIVTSHWHNDHIAGNEVYADRPIIQTALGDQILHDLEADLEAGTTFFGPPAINPLVFATETFVGSKTLHVGSIRLELRQINIHSPDELVVLLPQDDILFSGDTTEDTETFMVEYADLKIHSQNLKEMRKMKFKRILPNHGNPDVIEAGGYDKQFIDATREYINNMVAGAPKPNFLNEPLENFTGKYIREPHCTVSLFEPYRDVHEFNKQGVFAAWGTP
jgi:glyoxylase-like metal-dependent hydrolase (beta-lactamase superfamily II)